MSSELKVSGDVKEDKVENKDQVILCIKNMRKFELYFQSTGLPMKCFKPKNSKVNLSECVCVCFFCGFKGVF